MLRSYNWDKWGTDFVFSVMRHVGTAGTVYTGLAVKSGKFSWAEFGQSLLIGAIIPTVLTAFQNPPQLLQVTVTTMENADAKVTQTTTTQVNETKSNPPGSGSV